MSQTNSARLESMFREDTEGMIELLHLIVARLARGDSPADSIDQAFRYAHSIRSEALFLGYDGIVGASRELELVLRRCRETGAVSTPDVEMVRDAVVSLEHAFADARPTQPPDRGAVESGVGRGLLDAPLDETRLRLLRQSRVRGESLFLLRCRITEDPQMIAPRLFLVVGNLEKACHVLDTNPRLDGSLDGVDTLEALCAVEGDEDSLRRAVSVDAVEDVEIQSIDYDELDASPGSEYRSGMIAESNRVHLTVDTRAYEQLCLHSDELIHQLHEVQLRDAEPLKSLSRESRLRLELTERLADSVARTIRATAYVPARGLLEPLPAIVRRLARDAGKRVRVQLSSQDVELFLPAADIVRDVILHLVRNAVDHGIEKPAVRAAAGKNESGVIRVGVVDSPPFMVLTVSDDGAGIPDSARRSGQSLWSVVSTAGFSTAGPDSGVSGEGVGLDSVRYSVERVLGGSVELTSTAGGGTAFQVRVPSGGRPLSVVVVRSGNRHVAVPAAYIVDRIQIDMQRVGRDSDGALEYRYADSTIPLRSLEAGGVKASAGAGLHGLVMAVGANRQMIVVNEVVGEETVLRESGARDEVFSQSVNRNIGMFLPLRYL